MLGHFEAWHKVSLIGELFRNAKLNPSDAIFISTGSNVWWQRYWQVICAILSVWDEMPTIAFLLGNMLSIDPEKRMTAKGIIDYLEGKCKPKEYEKNAEKIALFGDVSAEKLREMMKMEGFKRTTMKNVKNNLKSAEENIKIFMQQLEERSEFCEN
ncbi:hypothetical protein niasHT_013088 [Heterodera trifolii]|uniref:Uncharacterized protein n=1 Tax=Heterodera trifolii TaxID=157864 RepID=A0ABD2L7H9_9BILA